MKVLLLSQWYPPEPWHIYGEMAEGLAALGNDVTVITGYPNYPSGRIYPGYRMRGWKRERVNGVTVVRVPLYPDHSGSAVKRIANFATFGASAAALGRFLVERPDVIYAIQPPTVSVAAALLGELWGGVPFVYDVQDMWPETLNATGMMRNGFALRLAGAMCDWVHERATAIRVISPGFRRDLLRKGVPPQKVHFIPNWVDAAKYRTPERDTTLASRLGLGGRFVVVYAGNVGLAQGLDVVVDAAELLQDRPDVRFLIVGDGVDLGRIQAAAASRKVDNVLFAGRVPAAEVPRYFSIADALMVHLRPDDIFRMTIPHKTLAYLAAGKPVIAAVEGDVADVVASARAGVACRSAHPAALADAVRYLRDLPASEREQLGRNGRAAAEGVYSREHQVRNLDSLLRQIVSSAR